MHSTWKILMLVLAIGSLAPSISGQGIQPKPCLTKFNRQVVDAHEQRYGMSCIPMSIEMVLKLLGRVPSDYYELQTSWKEKADGNFKDFNGKTIKGVTFHQQFDLQRNSQFPLTKLFETIDKELKAGRFVIASLASAGGWHMYVIYDEDADGDFLAVSKAGSKTIEEKQLKKIITRMQGTDIMTYEVPTWGQIADDFTADRALNTSVWTTHSTLLDHIARLYESEFVTPSLDFSSGMRMSGVNGELQFTGIQSLSRLTPPFTLRATVTPTVAAANAFVVLLVSADAKTWLALHGNPQPGSGHQGVAINYSSQAEPKDVPGTTLYPNPTLGVTYTTQVILDPAGNGIVQLLDAKGSLLASQGGIHVGAAPLYLVLGQREGQPMVQGPNVAVWQSVSASPPQDASIEEHLEPMVNKPLAGPSAKGDRATGTWKVEGVAFAPWTFTLQAEGDKLTGAVSQRGLVPDEAPGTIYDGAIQGNQITFKCDSADRGRTITFSGVVAGDSITFTREVNVHPGQWPGMEGVYGAYGPAHFTAHRVVAPTAEAGLNGLWKVEGVAYAPWMFALQAEGGRVTGTASQDHGDQGAEAATIHSGTVVGDQVSFKCDKPSGGRTITFSGVQAGDTITFTREVTVHPGGDPGFNGLYGAYGPAQFTARRVAAPTAEAALHGETYTLTVEFYPIGGFRTPMQRVQLTVRLDVPFSVRTQDNEQNRYEVSGTLHQKGEESFQLNPFKAEIVRGGNSLAIGPMEIKLGAGTMSGAIGGYGESIGLTRE